MNKLSPDLLVKIAKNPSPPKTKINELPPDLLVKIAKNTSPPKTKINELPLDLLVEIAKHFSFDNLNSLKKSFRGGYNAVRELKAQKSDIPQRPHIQNIVTKRQEGVNILPPFIKSLILNHFKNNIQKNKIEQIPMNSEFFKVKTRSKFFQQTIPEIHRLMRGTSNEHRKIADRIMQAIHHGKTKELQRREQLRTRSRYSNPILNGDEIRRRNNRNSYIEKIQGNRDVLENKRFQNLFQFSPKELTNLYRRATLENLFKKSNTLEQKLNLSKIIRKYSNYYKPNDQ